MSKNSLFKKFMELGYHESDSENEKLRKSTLLIMSTPFAIAGLIWGILYFFNDLIIPGLIPFCYGILSIFSILLFSITKKYTVFRSSQLILILVLPFALQSTLGGFIPSSGVIMWAIIAPLGSLIFFERKKSLIWFASFILLVIISYLINDELKTYFNWEISEDFINVLFLMNIIGISLLVFSIQYYFVSKRTLLMKLIEDKHQWIKDAFSSYLSPNLVEHLIKNPNELKLGGQRRECTFIFTDLVGFTTLIEQSDPAQLVEYLNEYFEGMTTIVFKHEGTVSKIVGDAIAVMFSAPIVQKDHAEKAVACALEMDAYAQNFADEKKLQGLEMGRTRIGVHTGNVIIGNMVSKSQLDYRALGDAVNTAARLESANKQIGTRVCVSKSTMEKCANFIGRPIGFLLLKGKTNPVLTFQPLTKSKFESPHINEYLTAYKLIENSPKIAQEILTKLIKQYPNDSLALFHLKRLQTGISTKLIELPWK